jgi:hypothetical protein
MQHENKGTGFGPALTQPIKVSSPPFQPVGFSFALCQAGRSVGSPSPVVRFAVRPIPLAGKIERPTAGRTVFEILGGMILTTTPGFSVI